MIYAKTPFRISLFGGGTDYPSWFERYGGVTISFAIQQFSHIFVGEVAQSGQQTIDLEQQGLHHKAAPNELDNALVKNALSCLGISESLSIRIENDLPTGSGVGSSSSVTVSLLRALSHLKSINMTEHELFEKATLVEREMSQSMGGLQDQIAAVYGGFNIVNYEKGSELEFNLMRQDCKSEFIQAFKAHLMLGYTGLTRNSSSIADHIAGQLNSGEIHSAMQGNFDCAKLAKEEILKQGSFEKLGEIMNTAWQLKKKFSTKITRPEINQMLEIALTTGAYGGKLMGAGAGGFLLFIAPPSKHKAIQHALDGIRMWVPIEFEDEGSRLIPR